MPAILLFPPNARKLEIGVLLDLIEKEIGLKCSFFVDGKKVAPAAFKSKDPNASKAQVWVELENLQEDEGEPIAEIEVKPRAERSAEIQEMLGELVSQDRALDKALNKNSLDVTITFEDSDAGFDAGCVLAYAAAANTSSPLLIPSFEEDAQTVWYEDSEDFWADVFGGEEDEDDEDEDDEEYEDEEDVEDDEDDDSNKRGGGSPKGRK